MAYSGRLGLAALPVTGDTVLQVDLRQSVYHGLSVSEGVARLMGGEGIYSGGASVFGDITGAGTIYPAFLGVVADDGGQYWWFRKASGTTMTFNVTTGACTAYLVIGQVAGVSPVMATGGVADFSIVVQLTITAAPAHSIPLGSGAVTTSKFDDWTVDPAIMVGGGLGPFQPRHANLTAFAGLTLVADRLPYANGAGTLALATFTAAGRAILDDADATAQRATLGLVIGTNVQAYDAELAALAGLTSAADKLPYFTGSGTAALADLVAAARTILSDTVALTDYSATSTIVGWTSFTTKKISVKKIGKTVIVYYYLAGTSDSTAATFTLAHTNGLGFTAQQSQGSTYDNSIAEQNGTAYIANGASTVTLRRQPGGALWTNAGTKVAAGVLQFDVA